jgi:hypothetical protein
MAMRVRGDALAGAHGVDPRRSGRPRGLIERLTQLPRAAEQGDRRRERVRATRPGIHQDGLLKDARTTRSSIRGARLEMTLPLGKHSGPPRRLPGM